MRIISYNVNGIRAAINKGLIDWLKTDPADVICLQKQKQARIMLQIIYFMKQAILIITGIVHKKRL